MNGLGLKNEERRVKHIIFTVMWRKAIDRLKSRSKDISWMSFV